VQQLVDSAKARKAKRIQSQVVEDVDRQQPASPGASDPRINGSKPEVRIKPDQWINGSRELQIHGSKPEVRGPEGSETLMDHNDARHG
jgi:hypothetical protein